MHGRVRCFVCGEFGAGFEDPTVRKCSLGVCGRFYHIKYAYASQHMFYDVIMPYQVCFSTCLLSCDRSITSNMLCNMCVVM